MSRHQARISLQPNRFLLQQLHCEPSGRCLWTRNQHPTLQVLSLPLSVVHSSSLGVKPPVAVWGSEGFGFQFVLALKGFEALFVLKQGTTTELRTDHFPKAPTSCSQPPHLPLWPHRHCSHTHAAAPCTPREHAVIHTQIERGLGELRPSHLKHRLGVCTTSTAELLWFGVWNSFTRRVDSHFYRICLSKTYHCSPDHMNFHLHLLPAGSQ